MTFMVVVVGRSYPTAKMKSVYSAAPHPRQLGNILVWSIYEEYTVEFATEMKQSVIDSPAYDTSKVFSKILSETSSNSLLNFNNSSCQ